VQCHACGNERSLRSGERVGTRDACEGCGADLHVCLNCAHHDGSAYNECRESSAERVLDKAGANRCDYFTPAAQRGPQPPEAATKAALERLFRK